MLRGIDVSSFKGDLNLANISCDFVVAKATGGIGYVDAYCDAFVQQAIALNKKWGVYHYFNDGFNDNDPIAEADYFVGNCLGYVGKGLLILDWERGGNPVVGRVDIAKAWLDRVYERTGVKPLIYMSTSLVTSMDWSSVINAGYGLWTAAWPFGNNVVSNYGVDPNTDPNPRWDGVVNDSLWQFTSTGRLDGYGGNLDCNFFYGTREAWDAYARSNTAAPSSTTTTTTQTSQPEPTTTTTVVQPEPTTTTTTMETPPDPNGDSTSTTTTSSTTGAQPGPAPSTSTTTTTTTQQTPQTWFVKLWLLLVAIFNKLKGTNK